ncbi:Holliday junction resolvase RuvX [Candidatus Gracilibacteria bacterium]|jgi:putative Holliday junction resolvase|nr:Holliday junction resolvase RuvX [Candidatus Gracilibacteria bacterium]
MSKGKAVCIDYGKKRIGVATGSLEMKIAFPKEVFDNKGVQNAAGRVCDIVSEYEAKIVILGYPLDMEEGKRNLMMGEVERFYEVLKKTLPENVEVILFDERLSSFEAKDLFKEARANKTAASGMDDSYAAQITLQRYFDRM